MRASSSKAKAKLRTVFIEGEPILHLRIDYWRLAFGCASSYPLSYPLSAVALLSSEFVFIADPSGYGLPPRKGVGSTAFQPIIVSSWRQG